jgi:aspartyl-tRNA(Asn)/glutamyl-tRNA(Gln) amidotransferase subunit A
MPRVQRQVMLPSYASLRSSNNAIGDGLSLPNPPATVAVKDNIVTTGSTTTCASGFLKDYVSPFEALVVRQLRKNDYGVAEKTNMDEFGMGSHSTHSYFGPVSNRAPLTHRSAGGSSGGSAVAVAMGAQNFALGTDTGGSVRLPAAYNGVVGFKPSYGKISRWGVIPYANSLDTVGIFALRCSKSLRRCLAKLSGHDPRDPTSLTNSCRSRLQITKLSNGRRQKETKQIRIGVPIEYNIQELQPIIRDAWSRVLEQLQKMGHIIVPVSLPSTKHALSAYYVLAAAEAASNLAKYDGVRYGTSSNENDDAGTVLYDSVRGNGFGDEVKRRILLGSYTLSSEAIDNYFIQAQKVRRIVQRDFDWIFATPNPLRLPEQFDLSDLDEGIQLEDKLGPAQVDVLVCPTAPTLPPPLEEISNQAPVDSYMNDVFTVPASLAGLPAVSVPVDIARSRDNVSFAGIQVIGQYWDDYLVLRVGGLIQTSAQSRKSVGTPRIRKISKEMPIVRRMPTGGKSAISHHSLRIWLS